MKKIIILVLALLSIVWLYTTAQNRNGLVLTDTQTAIDYLYTQGLTRFSTANTFMADKNLRRDEAAAFFSRLARDVLWITPDTSLRECYNFTDLSLGYKDLQGEMIAWCQLGLFKGSDGKFMPTASFTNAQALTVLIRLIDGIKEENGSHWAENYLNTAKALWLTNWLSADNKSNLDKPITRGDVAKLIEAGATYRKTTTQSTITQTGSNALWEENTPQSNTTTNNEVIWLNTPFIIDGIEYEIKSIRLLDKIWSSTNEYIWYKYPSNGKRLMVEYSFKNISAEYWYAWDMRIQNNEDLYDESITAQVYSEEQMGYEYYSTSILEGAKKNTYVWFDVNPDNIQWATLFVKARVGKWNNSIKIPLKNLLD